jgi:hypothetical protein
VSLKELSRSQIETGILKAQTNLPRFDLGPPGRKLRPVSLPPWLLNRNVAQFCLFARKRHGEPYPFVRAADLLLAFLCTRRHGGLCDEGSAGKRECGGEANWLDCGGEEGVGDGGVWREDLDLDAVWAREGGERETDDVFGKVPAQPSWSMMSVCGQKKSAHDQRLTIVRRVLLIDIYPGHSRRVFRSLARHFEIAGHVDHLIVRTDWGLGITDDDD